ncbi:MAG: hypothetical protein HY242_16385 [Afipia sp.]|nr:hypothetical protein [Afipia sp.]
MALLALLALVSGCASSGQIAMPAGQSFGPTVAFESVDGPPQQVFDRLVRALETESSAKSFMIVSREAPAAYRIRSYLSAQVRRGKTTIAWVWDVYDRNQNRALRLSGEEPTGKAGRDAWATADDQVMRRIAAAGLNGVSSMINGTAPAPEDPTPEAPRTGPAVASADEIPADSASPQITAVAFSAH